MTMGGWPLVGRAEELAVIEETLDAGGRHRAMTIAGAPGVGKTRLAHEAAALAAARGITVRWLTGAATTAAIPMGAFAEWVEGTPGDSPAALHRVVTRLARSIPSPQWIVVDDAHLLDDGSAAVLAELARLGTVTVVTTARAGAPCPAPLVALHADRRACRLELQSLSRRDSDTLVRAALGGPISGRAADRLWDLTRGNPLYLRELISQERTATRLARRDRRWDWDGALTVSASLTRLVELHLGAGAEPLHDVVDLLAVGEPLDRRHLAALVDPALITAAQDRGLIAATADAQGDTLRLAHPLYGEVRREDAGWLRLRRLRGRLARELARHPGTDPVRLALLWRESDLDPDPEVYVRAAGHAGQRDDFVLAEQLAAAAVAAGAGPHAHIIHARFLRLLRRATDAEALLARLDTAALDTADRATVVFLRAAYRHWALAQPPHAAALLDAAQTADPSAAMTAQADALRAATLAMAAHPAAATALAATLDRAALTPVPAVTALSALALAHGDLGDPQRAVAAARAGYRGACADPEAAYQTHILVEFHCSALALAGHCEDAARAAARAHRHCRQAGGIAGPVAAAVAGLAALYSGDLTAAAALLDPACDDFAAHPDSAGLAYRFAVAATQVAARRGDLTAATARQDAMRAGRHPGYRYVHADELLADAWVAAVGGRLTEAQNLARTAAAFAAGQQQYAREVLCLQTAAQLGATDPTIGARLDELADRVAGPRAAVAALLAHALTRTDADALTSAGAALEELGDPLAAADAYAHAGAAHRRAGRRGAALSVTERAQRILADRRAISPAARTAASPWSLSPREREIAAMVSQGMSNRTIAAALQMPRRTVEGHVYRACTKIGVNGRKALAEAAGTGPPQ
jgi:DNA-binding CsgD family transcriptional regulator